MRARFDLIYLVLDKPDERTDRKLAAHLVSLYFKVPPRTRADHLSIDTLTDYISFAKKHVHPKISDAASDDLIQGYIQMRKLGENKKTITATPRQLESLIRISEAHARMRFSETVERIDVAEAVRLVRSAIQQAAIDPRTGTIDMDLITTGRSANFRSRMADLVRNLISIDG
jgi:DNA replication licensing factor MCM4